MIIFPFYLLRAYTRSIYVIFQAGTHKLVLIRPIKHEVFITYRKDIEIIPGI